LTRGRVLETAVRLADESGIESLSMRKLARELGVEAMSLYNHVASKADMVDGIVDLVVGEIELPEDGEWDDAIKRCALSAHEAFLRHPWACSLVIRPSGTGTMPAPRLGYMDWLLGRLGQAGFAPELTYHAYHVLDAHVVGFTLWELGHLAMAQGALEGNDPETFMAALVATLREEYPHVAGHAAQHLSPPPGKGGFEFGLDLILDGLKRALNG